MNDQEEEAMNLKNCVGCVDDFYNGRQNITGDRCWNFADAKIEKRKLIPTSMPPPYNTLPAQSLPNCYRKIGYVSVKPERLTASGYWR